MRSGFARALSPVAAKPPRLSAFASTQDAHYGFQGQTCSIWDMNYTLVNERGDWRIDEAELATGDGPRVLTLAPPSQATPLPFPVDDRPRGGMCVRSV